MLSIAVAGDNQGQADAILAQTETCTAGTNNVYCRAASTEEIEQAHEAGLSFGKYEAFLALQALDPSVTPEDVQGLTMREIRDRIAALDGDLQSVPGGHGYGAGSGNGAGQGNGMGQDNGQGGGQANGLGTGQGNGTGQGYGQGAGQGHGAGNGNGCGKGQKSAK